MQHRLLVSSLLLPLVLTGLVVPATAGKAKPSSSSATATITDNGGCSFTVAYTWSGFSGSGLVAELGIGYKGEWGADFVLDWTRIPGQDGSGGSISATFSVIASTPHEYFGRGNLFKTSRKSPSGLKAVSDASAVSGYLAPQAC